MSPPGVRHYLTCYLCGSQDVTVSESQQMKKIHGRTRLHADVRCSKCKHRWWSVHASALRMSRVRDDFESRVPLTKED